MQKNLKKIVFGGMRKLYLKAPFLSVKLSFVFTRPNIYDMFRKKKSHNLKKKVSKISHHGLNQPFV